MRILKTQSHIQRVFNTNLLVWVPKLCAQISEKQLRKNLIHSNHAVLKSLLQLYLSIVKNLTLRYTYLKKKAIKTLFMLPFNQFLVPILNSHLLCVLNITIHVDALSTFLGWNLSTKVTFKRV